MYKLIEFTDEKEYINMFLSLPRTIYKGDGNYTHERKKEVACWLAGKHACAKFLRQKNLIVLKDGLPAARGIAFVNEIGKFGSIGFLEFKDHPEAVKLLTGDAKEFFKAYGVSKIYAPMNGSIWSNYRIMTKGFEDRTYMGEPYNKPYYYDVLTKCGYKAIKKWESQFVNNIRKNEVEQRIRFVSSLKSAKGVYIRSMEDFDKDIRILHKLIMNSFSGFFLFHELDEQTYVELYKNMKKICDKRTMSLAFDKDGRPIGFGLAFPDYKSKLNFLLKCTDRYILWFFGVLQDSEKGISPFVFKDLISPVLQFLYSKNKGCISAMMSENSKTLTATKKYDATHEYVLLEAEID